MANPLLIPEVVLVAAGYLTAGEATGPARVCRLWYSVFSGVVWWACSVNIKTANKELDLQGLFQNASHIRSLTYGFDIGLNNRYLAPCTYLTTFSMYNTSYLRQADEWGLAIGLVQCNEDLQEVRVCFGAKAHETSSYRWHHPRATRAI